jgi:hypothetical protein
MMEGWHDMMSASDLDDHLLILGLTQADAAQLLSVSTRTVARWTSGEEKEIPGPVEQAFRAWMRLHERHLAWRPDSVSIVQDDQDQIARQREHGINISELMARVEARGGVRIPWDVDLERRRAVLGPLEVSFYSLANGSVSPANYTRKDRAPDVKRDWEMIEDAIYCILKAQPPLPPLRRITMRRLGVQRPG